MKECCPIALTMLSNGPHLSGYKTNGEVTKYLLDLVELLLNFCIYIMVQTLEVQNQNNWVIRCQDDKDLKVIRNERRLLEIQHACIFIKFYCLWLDCEQLFDSLNNFHSHFKSHIEMFGFEIYIDGNYRCPIKQCLFTSPTKIELLRHIFMHEFHAIRQYDGLFAIMHRSDTSHLTSLLPRQKHAARPDR
ncbi:unnamed protein product [Dracunculus medinensis]|uniref:C2H2-type domain-containing protein n=1 Tax=Dracunculus medinensis TaxID=318479 RepID=A0A0N4UDF8_DRAME|nr:unnamed protein product [Dracunculus medinensis]